LVVLVGGPDSWTIQSFQLGWKLGQLAGSIAWTWVLCNLDERDVGDSMVVVGRVGVDHIRRLLRHVLCPPKGCRLVEAHLKDLWNPLQHRLWSCFPRAQIRVWQEAQAGWLLKGTVLWDFQ
jgi:hypothetical protein